VSNVGEFDARCPTGRNHLNEKKKRAGREAQFIGRPRLQKKNSAFGKENHLFNKSEELGPENFGNGRERRSGGKTGTARKKKRRFFPKRKFATVTSADNRSIAGRAQNHGIYPAGGPGEKRLF